MYVSDRALALGDHPLFVDMRGASWAGTDSYALADGARRFEDWEFPYALVLAWARRPGMREWWGSTWAGSGRSRSLRMHASGPNRSRVRASSTGAANGARS